MKMRNKRKALHKKYKVRQPTLNQESFDKLCDKARAYLKKRRSTFVELMDRFDNEDNTMVLENGSVVHFVGSVGDGEWESLEEA